MIIWGTYVTKKIIEKGQFYCPGCTQHRDYNLRRPKKWGHLYWIPLIPMQELGRYVECTSCDKAWNESVLQHDPIRDRAEHDARFAALIAQLMLLMSGDNMPTPALTERIIAASEQLTGLDATPDTVAAAIQTGADRATALSNAARLADHLTDRGKEATLRTIIAAAPHRPLGEREWVLAADIGKNLGMTPAYVSGVMAEMAAS